mmetsp:Transcript_16193/g.32782  ORF Transcript_16193/g.32782 Transcript_16193/m.32782 type:complete len:121 (+) Transcript_16193:361-723(+)
MALERSQKGRKENMFISSFPDRTSLFCFGPLASFLTAFLRSAFFFCTTFAAHPFVRDRRKQTDWHIKTHSQTHRPAPCTHMHIHAHGLECKCKRERAKLSIGRSIEGSKGTCRESGSFVA